ncbi:MAG TPA: glycoside hydrolase family 2 TIM barrel-domain containing protein [Protaetiibacter sp.]|nr:glycoside hydrolase family 2 TIM barrel-domain containing protein [Protaetiibacter sp.]
MNTHPRPLLTRDRWHTLDGTWEFAFDADAGTSREWSAGDVPLPLSIEVPFAPQAPASRVGVDPASGVVWYRRVLAAAEVRRDEHERVVLHFGAVDHTADVWVNGNLVVRHRGGHVPFSADITDELRADGGDVVVVRAVDPRLDAEIPRGKQAWALDPHFIWYQRTIGIWRTPWIEVVPQHRLLDVAWSTDIRWGVTGTVEVSDVAVGARLRVELLGPDGVLGSTETHVHATRVDVAVPVVALRNAQARGALLWSPESPTLITVRLTLLVGDAVVDEAGSYVGLREVAVRGGRFLLNGRPYRTRAVLAQGYWPDGHFTAPDAGALEREAELAKEFGFNTVRVHQKIEDPRFLAATDRLGLLVWAEAPAAYAFSLRSAEDFLAEWVEALRLRRSHPSVVCWVPFNESWGVQDLSDSDAQRDFVQAVTTLTRALDPSRPVISNDGWEHVDSDIIGIHDYCNDPALLVERFGDADAVLRTALGPGPQGRRIAITEALRARIASGELPLMLSEFGGISWSDDASAWGYHSADDCGALRELLEPLFRTVHALDLDGFCYTQLTDTAQETNGLAWPDRTPKLPVETIRALVLGTRTVPAPLPG